MGFLSFAIYHVRKVGQETQKSPLWIYLQEGTYLPLRALGRIAQKAKPVAKYLAPCF